MVLTYKSIWDKLSIGASVACAIHCVLLPLVLTTLPIMGVEIMENLYLELATITVSAFVGGAAIWKGFRKHHHSKMILMFFLLGILLLLTGNILNIPAVEKSFKIAGASLLITSHIKNWRRCRECTICHEGK